MAIFLLAEAMLFAGLISAMAVLRSSHPDWPPADQPRLPLFITLANMLLLLASGGLLIYSRGDRRTAAPVAAMGVLFLVVQGFEWSRLISFGFSTSAGPFAGLFYAIIGTHALHALGGVAALVGSIGAARRSDSNRVSPAVVMYWSFVVIVWPLLFVLVYL